MSKRIFYIIIASVVLGLLLLYLLFFKPQAKFDNLNAFKAVPSSTPVVIKINKPLHLLELNLNNELLKSITTLEKSNSFQETINELNKLIESSEYYQKLLKGNELIVSLNFSGKENINPMLILALQSKNDIELSNKIIHQLKMDEQITIQTRKYNKVIINEISKNQNHFFLAISNGILLLSEKSLLVEEGILQLNLETVENDKELNPLIKTVSHQTDLNVFINHKNVNQLSSKYVSKHIKLKSELLKTYSGWTELDVNIEDDKISMSGFTNGDKFENYYANTILNQQSTNSKIEKILPHSTPFYASMCLSDIAQYFSDYQSYLDKRNLFFQRENILLNIEKETGHKIQDLFEKITEQEITYAGINVDQNNPTSERVWILETKSGSTALNQILEIQSKFITHKELIPAEWKKNYKIDNQTNFEIYRFPYPNLPKTLFGQIFSGMEANWFTIYDNYLIFGDTYRTVTKILHSNVLGENLSTNIEYNKFKSNLNTRSNITFYCNTSISIPVVNLFFNEKLSEQIKNNDDLRKFKSFAWQVTATGDMLYNNSCLLYNAVIKSKPQTIWQSHMESAFDFKPKFVINHYDIQNKEVVLLDQKHKFYLINNVGRVIWQIQLNGPILGEVRQIDYYRNGKLQYLFNTKNRIYLIDRNGNNVKNFPINLRSKASNGMSAFDYDNNKDYRFFVACADQNIYAYSKDGNILKGWNIYKTDHLVTHPIQHFRVEGKDYIVATDKMKDYILDRRGNIRVKTNDVYPHSTNNPIYLEERSKTHEPRMVSSESNGALHYTYFDGRHEIVNYSSLSEKHFFLAENIDSNEENEYLFVDGNQLRIIDSKGKTILKKKFDYSISYGPNIYSFSKNIKKVGITCKEANRIYLLDIDGSVHAGFPLDGNTEFSIGFISDEMSNFNLLVGSPGGYLYNYYVE